MSLASLDIATEIHIQSLHLGTMESSYKCVGLSIYIYTYTYIMFYLGYGSVLGHIHSYPQPHMVSHM